MVGAFKNEGYYKLDLDNFPHSAGFYKASNIRMSPNAEPNGPPRSGKYKIIGTGSGRNSLLGYFILTGGNSYSLYDLNMKPGGKGSFTFNDASQTIVWLSGPFKEKNFGGVFKSSFQGSKHSIIMNSGTTAENIKE